MAFIVIPIVYVDGSNDSEDILALKRKKGTLKVEEADLTINTTQICSYIGEDENDHTLISMADGSTVECTFDRDTFDDLLETVDSIIDLTPISTN